MDNQEMSSNGNSELLNSTISLLERGETKIALKDEYRNLVLILGDEAIDISFIRWITGDDTNGTLIENEKSSDEFINEEGSQIGDFTLKYQKECPELITEAKENTFYYSCSCFNDAKSTNVDIASTYLTNKVLNHAERIKIIFMVNYSSLKKGAHREDFIKFLRRATNFVKEVEKYRTSLAMVAKGVDKQYLTKGSDSVLVDDIQIMKDIVDFLLDIKKHITDEQKDAVVKDQDRKFYEHALKFIDVLLEKDGERYKKIGIFRKQGKGESYSDFTLLQEGKDNMKKILCEELSFTEKLDRDFECTISEKSEQDIDKLEEEINNVVWLSVRRISENLHKYYQNQIQKLLHKLECFATDETIVEADPVEAVSLSFKFKDDYYTISSLVDDLQNSMKVKGLVKKIKDFVSTLDITVADVELQNIERYGKYIDILEAVSKKEFRTRPWGNLFDDVAVYISESRKMIQNAIDTALEKVKHRIQLNLKYIAKKIQQNYNKNLKSRFTIKTMEIEKLHEEFSKEYDKIFKMTEDIKRLRTIDSLVKKLQATTNISGITSSKRYITNIANEGKYFMFLHFLSDKILDNGYSTWPNGFKEVTDFLQESEKWYKFLSDLYTKLSEYDTQMGRKNYVDFLERKEESDIFHETNITPINFEIFLGKIRDLKIAEYESVKNIALTESRLQELNHLVNLTLKHTITIQCSDTHMFVKGDYVSLEEVRRLLSTHDDKECREFYHQKPYRKFVNIFTLNTLFIDRDIDLQGYGIQLIYISPRWEVIGNRVINLNGSDGTRHFPSKSYDRLSPGNDGGHGKPGEPGGPGEIFYGIGGTFVNGANLTITANGGAGSKGQDGGNGYEGIPGYGILLPKKTSRGLTWPLECCYWKQHESLSEEEYTAPENATFQDLLIAMEAISRRDFLRKISHETKNGFGCEKILTRTEHYKIFGKPGKKGGNGGNGGTGGMGGNPGSVTVTEMESPSGINTYANNGTVGDIGEGGWGGKGGKDGADAHARCIKEDYKNSSYGYLERSIEWRVEGSISHDRRGISGRNGRNGANSENIKLPVPAKLIHEPAEIINKYKSYLRESLTDDLKKISLLKFYEQMNKNTIVRKMYNIAGLVGEFVDLEDEFHLIKEGVDFYPFYKSLLERIDEYSDCSEGNCDTSRDRKIVLSYLYAAVLSKIRSLKESSEADLIIDVETYLDTVKKEIDILKDIEKVNSKAEAVDEMKKEYKKRIDDKIEEAKYFIDNTVEPEINRINKEIDNKIDLLINETISLQNKAKKEKDELERKKKELQKALKLRKLFNCFKVLGRIISFLGPYGMAIGAAIELGTSVGESLALGNKLKPLELSNAASKLNAVENNIKMMRIENTEYLNNVLTELSEKIMQHPEELGEMSREVSDMKIRLNDIRTHKLQYKEIRKLERELKGTLKTKEIDLKSQGNKKSRDVSKMVKKFGQAVAVGSTFVEIYNKNKEDDERMAAINDAIEQKENELRMLREYEEQIYETISPALQNMKSNLQVFSNELNKRSQVALDVGKWQVQTALKDMRIQMQRMTEGMEVKDDLARCIEKLEEAMSILITIYDRIQQYQDEQVLSNYIVNVCSVNPSTLSIADRNLVNVTNHLEWSIRSSLVLKRYQTALNAFKQWVFPFISYYLDESMLPSHFQLDKNIQNLVFKAAEQIENLQDKLKIYKSTARETDEILIHGNFNSRCVSCDPFFEWKDEQYGSEIARLLSGKAVALKADVRLSEPGKDAIKFNLIKLNFKSKNESLQSQLDETLKKFDISAIHTGNSYYRYEEEIYLINNIKREISYSFEESSRTGNPVRDSEVNRKIKEAVPMLSPYTMWIFKLNTTRKGTFRELNIYKRQIDLELEGEGNFVRNRYNFEDDDYDIESQLETLEQSELKYRTVRSLVGSKRMKRYATNGSGSNLSSPINYVCNFVKMFTMSVIMIPYKRIINFSSRALYIDDIMNRYQMTSTKSEENNLSNKKQEIDVSNPSTDLLEKRSLGVDEYTFSLKGAESTSDVKLCNYKITPNLNTTMNSSTDLLGKRNEAADEYTFSLKGSESTSGVKLCKYNIAHNFNISTRSDDFNKRVKPLTVDDQEIKYCNQSIQVPELNYTLLFADFIARSYTGVKYQSELDESMMSPEQVIFKKCNESPVKSEEDIVQNFRLFSEMNENIEKSWFSSIKGKIKLVFQSLGLLNKDNDEYIRDIRHLFFD